MVASSLALPTSFQTASFKSALGVFEVLKRVILDSCNGQIKFAYFVTPCSKNICCSATKVIVIIGARILSHDNSNES